MLGTTAKNAFKFQLFVLQCIYDNWPKSMEQWQGTNFHWNTNLDGNAVNVWLNVVMQQDLFPFRTVIPLDDFHNSDKFHAFAAGLARTVVEKMTAKETVPLQHADMAGGPAVQGESP